MTIKYWQNRPRLTAAQQQASSDKLQQRFQSAVLDIVKQAGWEYIGNPDCYHSDPYNNLTIGIKARWRTPCGREVAICPEWLLNKLRADINWLPPIPIFAKLKQGVQQ